MNEFTTTAAVLFGILLRFGIPIAITFGLSYLLRRLDEHWRAEAEEEAARAKHKAQQAALLQLWIQQPCWEIKNCSKGKKNFVFLQSISNFLPTLSNAPSAKSNCSLV